MSGSVQNFPADRRTARAEERPLPHNAAAEQAIAAAILQDAEACGKAIELLRREQFHDPQLGWILYAATQLRARSTPVDRVTVEAWLGDNGALEAAGGVERVRQIADHFPEPSHLAAHAAIVIQTWERREIALACRRIEREACAPLDDVEAWKATTRKTLGKLTAARGAVKARPIGAAVEEARAELQAAHLGQVSGVRYPWPRVEALVGLLVCGEQTMVAGYSEHGKTPFSTQVAVEVARTPVDALGFGEAVYYVSGEMPRAKLLMRLACSYAGLDVSHARLGLLHPDDQNRLGDWLGFLNTLPIEVDDQPAAADVLAKRVREARDEFEAGRMRTHTGEALGRRRLRLVVGDHVQELAEHESGGEERQRLARSAQRWRDEIAKGLGVATMLLSQLRAPNEQERKASPNFPPWPTGEMLFGSPNAMKAQADTVIAVHRPTKLLRGKNKARWQDAAMICALKRRFSGAHERVALRFDRGMFHDDLAPHERDFFESEGA